MSRSQTRDDVLGRIRKSLGAACQDQERRDTVQTRISGHPSNLVPARARKTREDQFTLFADMLKRHGATLTRLNDMQQIPETVHQYLRSNNLPAKIRYGNDEIFLSLPWVRTPQLELIGGPAAVGDVVALSHALAAAAETGTLFLASGPANPTTLNFLPQNHILVICANDLFGSYEEAWNRIRDVYGARMLPRALNLISGPSRTADIEQTIVMGAHGPKRLHVILVG